MAIEIRSVAFERRLWSRSVGCSRTDPQAEEELEDEEKLSKPAGNQPFKMRQLIQVNPNCRSREDGAVLVK